MRATISKVNETPRPWGDKYPDACSVEVLFADGSRGEVATKTNAAARHVEALSSIIGRECDFEVEDKGEYRGQHQWRIKGYPGKPQAGGAGGKGGGFAPSYRQGPEAFAIEQRCISRAVALKEACAVFANGNHGSQIEMASVLAVADQFFAWLSEGLPATPQPQPQPAPAAAPAHDPADQRRIVVEGGRKVDADTGEDLGPADPKASGRQVAELRNLMASAGDRIKPGLEAKWCRTAGVDRLEDMTANAIFKCSQFVKGKLDASPASAAA